MLFLALPPADMLPPAGHRAGPGRAHTGPIARSGWPGGRPCVLQSAGAAAAEAKAAPQSRSNSSSCPRPPRSSRPSHGGRGPGPGWHPPRKVSAGEIPAWSPRGEAAWSAPGPQASPRESHRLHARA